MDEHLKKLIVKAKSKDSAAISDALTDWGLLLERHTQNRYSEQDYLTLLGNNDALFTLRLKDEDVEILTNFFFYHILNIHIHPVTAAWCLGKCYNMDILDGMKRLLNLFDSNDEITLQLIYSINSLFGLEQIGQQLMVLRKRTDLPNTTKYLEGLSTEGFFESILN